MNLFKLPPHVKRIINYLRKSREEELQEERDPSFNALERQRIQMERVLKEYGVPFDQETEYGSGDKIESRPVFQKILNQIRSGMYQSIAVREVARLGRGSYEDMGQIYSLLEEKRIFIITESRIWDLRNADDAKFIRMQLFMSREEYFMIKERLQGAREFFAGEGKFMCSRPPFGYVSNPKTKILEIEPEQAKIIRMIFNWYVYGDEREIKGFGYQAIATKLNNMGIKTYLGKKIWQPLSIARILKTRTYVGDIIYKKTEKIGTKQIIRPREEWIVVKDAHEPIVSRELFDKVTLKLENKKEISPVVLEFDPCELASLILCGNCGRKMVRQYSVQNYQKDSGEISKYEKEFLYCRAGCRMTVKYRDVENKILKAITEFAEIDDDEMNNYIDQRFNEKSNNQQTELESVLSLLEKQRNVQQERLDFIFEQYEDRVYNKQEFTQRKNAVESELERIDSELANEIEKSKLTQKKVLPQELRVKLKTAVETYWKLNHKSHRNELLKRILNSVTVRIVKKGKGRNPSVLDVDLSFKKGFILTG